MSGVVRPEASRSEPARDRVVIGLLAGCIELAGESPVLVIAGEPGSRLRPSGEIPPVKRSVESPTMAVRLVRYVDDFVILCRRESQAREAYERVQEILTRLRLELHPEKTKLVELGIGKQGFDFLGCHFRLVRSVFRGRCYLFRWPSARAMNAVRERVRKLTNRRRWAGMRDIRDVIAVLNPVLRGWGNYFRTGNASKQFNSLDRFVTSRLVRLISQREGLKRRPFYRRDWPHTRFVHDFGLHKLLGTIRYPGGAHAT